jgi:uncharacterized protein (DUF1778 family)
MVNRTEQLAARVDPARLERIRYASALQSTTVSAFVVDAAYEKAEQVIDEHRSTLVPSDYFDHLLAALDEPPRGGLRSSSSHKSPMTASWNAFTWSTTAGL